MNGEMVEIITRRWRVGGYAELAMWNEDWEMVEALVAAGLLRQPEAVYTTEPPVPFEGAACELHG